MRNGLIAPLLLSLLALTATIARADGSDLSREYRIKAAYLYNLGKFITWPDEDAAPGDTPFTLCVYGHNPFNGYLEKLQERQIRGRAIAVRQIREKETLENCQMLFISQLNTSKPKLLDTPPPYPPILTISDDQDFLEQGGIISLVTVGNNIQLDINLTRAKQAGFNVSANLLEIAHRIQ